MKKFDLHIHSTCSRHKLWGVDALNTPQQIVEMAVRIGLDGIAVTDHNTIRGGQRAIQYVKEKGIQLFIIQGAEIRSNLGDILALGINEDIPPKLSVQATVDAIRDQGGIAIAAHPYKYNSKLGEQLKVSHIPIKFSAIEVFNSQVRMGANYKAVKLAESLNMPGVAGSDAHYVLDIGNAITCLDIENLSMDEVLKAITTNKIKLTCKYASLRHIMELYLRKTGQLLRRIVGKQNKTCSD
jgi:predicted metal-dependent phosphoesterase TrpH